VQDVDPDKYDFDEDDVVVTHEKSYAAGVPAVLVSLRRGVDQMGAVRTAGADVAWRELGQSYLRDDDAPVPAPAIELVEPTLGNEARAELGGSLLVANARRVVARDVSPLLELWLDQPLELG